jgi:DNA-binding response OmpR family regulator
MRCLIVEDEKKVADFIARGLRAERFAIDVAYDGVEGWRFASSYDYDLIILDLMLPGITGTELLQRTRKRKPETAIMLLTARDSTEDKVKHLEAGADDYVTKPFTFAELRARAFALVRRGMAHREPIFRVADLELDRLTQQVKRGGKKIDLTSKEYAVLEYLMANTGRALSRTMIVEHVWDEAFEGLTNIVDVYIGHLRHKLESGFSSKLIHTVRGAGYCISESDK